MSPSKQYCGSAFEPGYLRVSPVLTSTAPPPVLVPAELGTLAVWIPNQKINKNTGKLLCLWLVELWWRADSGALWIL